MANFYEILGVDRAASKEEIRTAYRSKSAAAAGPARMQLNRAWNVLSDDFQRERYEEDLEAGVAEDVEVAAAVVESPRRTGKRGSEAKDDRYAARMRATEARAEALRKRFPPLDLPSGFEHATPKTRAVALAIDAFLIMVLVIGAVLITVGARTPYTKAEEAQLRTFECVQYVSNTEIAIIDGKKADVDKKFEKQCATQVAAIDRDSLKSLEGKAAKSAKKSAETRRDDAVESGQKLIPPRNTKQNLIGLGATLLAGLLLILPARKNGQTIGKRLKGIMVRTEDGSVPSMATLLRRYGPAVLSVASLMFVGQIGQFVMLAVMWAGTNWSNNPNRQSSLDRWAKTVVLRPTSVA